MRGQQTLNAGTIDFRLTIHADVFERIHQNLSRSHVEEGGKLLGYLEQPATRFTDRNSSVEMKIETYIDSGPNLSHSEVHILPDGDYQEKIFRVMERWEPKIDHVGTWHSHHCNGLATLSEGDIRGYFESVNDPNYNLDFFVAYLVKKLNRNSIDGDFYLFIRGDAKFCRIAESSVNVLRGRSKFSDFLKAAEVLSSENQRIGYNRASQQEMTQQPKNRAALVEDKHWFLVNFPRAELRRGRQTGQLSWKWPVQWGNQIYSFKCTYSDQNKLILEAMDNTETIVKKLTLELNDERHNQIMDFVKSLRSTPNDFEVNP